MGVLLGATVKGFGLENERNTAKETEDRVSWLPGIPVLTVSRGSMHRLRPFAQGILLVTHSPPWCIRLTAGHTVPSLVHKAYCWSHAPLLGLGELPMVQV